MQKCVLNDFVVNGNSAKINMLRDNLNQLSISIIGDTLKSEILLNVFKAVPNNEVVSGYLNVNELLLANTYPVKNVKGSFDIKNEKLVKGGCYGVIEGNTTLALSAQPTAKPNESLISLSASDAGHFLKFFKITDSINGGTINIVAKNNLISDKSMSGAFEITDFIAKNDQLTRLIAFSSMKGLSNSNDYSVGFNNCLGSFVLSENMIQIENGKAVGPAVGISYSGSYARLADQFKLSGISLLTSAALNASKINGVYAAPYQINGSFGHPVLSIKPLKFISYNAICETFGNMLPSLMPEDMMNNSPIIQPISSDKAKDPFANRAFDNITTSTAETASQPKNEPQTTLENKFGVKINRRSKDRK